MSIYAKKVVNAAGPWVDRLREMDGSIKDKTLRLTKGVHLCFDQSVFPLQQAIYFDTKDGRMVFAIPERWENLCRHYRYFLSEDPQSPRMTVEDRSYLIEAIRYMFPSLRITERDIESSWAGVRPLNYGKRGRKPPKFHGRTKFGKARSGLITMAGGKLTGYRKMAETIPRDRFSRKINIGKEKRLSSLVVQTKRLPISGGDVGGPANVLKAISP